MTLTFIILLNGTIFLICQISNRYNFIVFKGIWIIFEVFFWPTRWHRLWKFEWNWLSGLFKIWKTGSGSSQSQRSNYLKNGKMNFFYTLRISPISYSLQSFKFWGKSIVQILRKWGIPQHFPNVPHSISRKGLEIRQGNLVGWSTLLFPTFCIFFKFFEQGVRECGCLQYFTKIGGGQTVDQLQGPPHNKFKFFKRNILGKRREKAVAKPEFPFSI